MALRRDTLAGQPFNNNLALRERALSILPRSWGARSRDSSFDRGPMTLRERAMTLLPRSWGGKKDIGIEITDSPPRTPRVTIDESGMPPPVSFFDEPSTTDKDEDCDCELDAYATSSNQKCLHLYSDDIAGATESVHTGVHRTIGEQEKEKRAAFGTFFGVFLPCCQNIVGAIYFVRLPWIVGCGGILDSFIIVSICNMVSLTAAISMSAIATNGQVSSGGTYFMLSRSLGSSVGSSVGLFFFLAISISVAMYFLVTIELAFKYMLPEIGIVSTKISEEEMLFDYRVFGTLLLLCMTIIVFIGDNCVSWFAVIAFVLLACTIVSIFTGLLIFTVDNNYSAKVCVLGDRVMRYSNVYMNNSIMCNKHPAGPLFKAYCTSINGTTECDDYFLTNKPELIPAVPGFSLELFMAQFDHFYTDKGNIPGTKEKATLDKDITTDITTTFVVLIGVYFPAITDSGSGFSGNLRDPQKSIPLGTLTAVLGTATVYSLSVILFGSSVAGAVLRDKFGESISLEGDLVLSIMAFPSKYIVLAGAVTATIGAGMQSLTSGARMLQSIADDQILQRLSFFAPTWNGEPTRALLGTFIIAEIGILLADVDLVAPIVTMFFLICYGFLNFVVTLQSLLDTLHWRPSFKYYHWTITLLGTALCLITMFIFNWRYALLSIVLVTMVYHYIEYKGAEKEWGDGMAGLSMSAALYALGRLKMEFTHTKNWRPQVLVLLKMQNSYDEDTEMFDEEDRNHVELAAMLKEGKGLLMLGTVLKGKLGDMLLEKMEITQIYNTCLDNAQVKAFVEVAVSESVTEGLSLMIQSAGLGALRPNTIVLGWPVEWTSHRNSHSYYVFLETMRNVALAEKACIVLKCEDTFPTREHRLSGTIDVWWVVHDGGMLLLLAFLMRRNRTWSKCKLRVFSVAQEDDNTEQIKKDLDDYIYQLRLDASVEVVQMRSKDISAYVYERTMKLEQRSQMLQTMQLKTQKSSLSLHRSTLNIRKSLLPNAMRETMTAQTVLENARGRKTLGGPDLSQKQGRPRPENLRHMNTALHLNELIRQRSDKANLVILNLPCVPRSVQGKASYMSFLEAITEGLDTTLLVRGTGSEVITIFN